MKRLHLASIIFLIASMAVSGCANESDAPAGMDPAAEPRDATIPFNIDGSLDFIRDGEVYHSIELEIADTDSTRERGMMQRTEFPDDTGMLFVFQSDEMQGFWMANTPLALDMIWIKSDGTISSISRYVQPMSQETVASEEPIRLVLEVPAGLSDTVGIIEGDRVDWRQTE